MARWTKKGERPIRIVMTAFDRLSGAFIAESGFPYSVHDTCTGRYRQVAQCLRDVAGIYHRSRNQSNFLSPLIKVTFLGSTQRKA